MRVLEKEVVSSYSMGKKNKHKLRKSKENENSDSSEEVSGKGCVHVNKAINFSTMKKGLGKQVFGECAGCAKDASKKEPKTLMDHLEGATSSDFIEEVEQTLWVCLQCGNQGCGRTSPEKHAMKHYETPRSSQHNIVINMTTWTAWCYDCDDELLPEKYKKVAECMEHIKKLACAPSAETSLGRNSNGGPSTVTDSVLNKGRPLSGKGAAAGCQKVKGLSNLGNTCFFNAVMQNLVQTYSLENLLGERKKGHPLKLQGNLFIDPESCSSSDEGDDRNQKNTLKDLPSIEVSISDPGPLTHALVVFLHDINTTSRSGCINPSALFGQVCKKAPRFKGMQQQDSHELLRYLMDNMKTEEIKRGQTGILKYFKLTENTNPKKVDEDVRLSVKAYGHQIKHTFVECLFGGQLISTVVCEECKYISQILEPFLDLSLPVTEEKPQRPNQLHGARKKESSTDLKEDTTAVKGIEGFAVKDDKMSKHQSKKQKKRQKRDARRHGKNKGNVDEGEKDEEDHEDKEEETEEKGEGETEKNTEQEEKYDASDADVEDNLESDTSRCYNKTLSDSVVGSLDDTIVESAKERPTISQEMDISAYRLDTTANNTSFEVETKIENCSKSHDQSLNSSHSLQASGLNNSKLNGPVNAVVTNGCDNEDVNVSYTLTNGCLEENDAQPKLEKEENDVNASFTFMCGRATNGICNGDINTETYNSKETLVNGNSKENIKKSETDTKTTHQTNSEIATEVNIENKDIENEEVRCKSDKSVSDLTSSVSTLSIGDVSSSLPSDLSQMTLKDATEDDKENRKQKVETPSSDSKVLSVNTDNANSGEQTAVNGDIHGNMQYKYVVSLSPTSKHNKLKEIQKEGQRKSINTLAERYHPTSGECSVESCLNQFTAAELLTGNNKFGCKNCTKLKYKNNPNKEKKETVYSNANKQYLVFQPPAVLTLHLKRFEQVGFSSRKVNRHVDFPFVLDIAPYCSSLTQGIKRGQKKILYSLYGVVEHSGRLTSGHYTAYVKVRPNIGTLNNFLNKHNVTLKEYLHTYAQHVVNGDHLVEDSGDDINLEGLVPPGRWYHISDSRVNEVTEASVERAQAYILFYERIY
ncbi:ubiquitin carboxyl-terminal hydrolase 16-like [Mercenaria mercenaria]|uniref:ubiquitin carboxyl-terminal hydrolase 16-like n=1 Tax=Mercenaria mercenaria TaxID=6596 RepID=UPI001E1D5BED|nr:ubiquitin carboxyl-terminal hydrolase 16-like [Mercenaria mercenaria]